MNNKDISTNSRILISELLLNPTISKYMIELKELRPEVFTHSINVAYLSAEVCFAMMKEAKFNNENSNLAQCDYRFVEDTVIGALLHDIGKLKISNDILLKKGRLSDEEFKIIQNHPIYGYELIKDEPFSDVSKEIILSHHEKLDGAGYPNHKRDIDILKQVQIVTVCDIYDALTEKRAYRNDKSIYTAFKILSEERIDELAFLLLASCPDI